MIVYDTVFRAALTKFRDVNTFSTIVYVKLSGNEFRSYVTFKHYKKFN